MKTIIFSLGGSIIVPNKVDYLFLGKFKKLLLRLSKNSKIVVVCGNLIPRFKALVFVRMTVAAGWPAGSARSPPNRQTLGRTEYETLGNPTGNDRSGDACGHVGVPCF